MTGAEPVLSVRDLSIGLPGALPGAPPGPQGLMRVIDGVSFDVHANEVLCIVGESGSGKSLSMMACMGLLPDAAELLSGDILFNGQSLLAMPEAARRRLRGAGMAMVFQDPMSALNPLMRVGSQIAETLSLHQPGLGKAARRERVRQLLGLVHIVDPATRARSYPHELSGGMRQRVMIAMAMAHRPALLIADEPTTALDVTVQAQILALLADMRRETGAAQVLITHDLGVVAQVADRVAVLYSGRVVESGTVADIFRNPSHPYTIGLLASLLHPGNRRAYAIPGQPPTAAQRPPGCVFQPRCQLGEGRAACMGTVPPLQALSATQHSACLYPDEARALRTQPEGMRS